MLKYGLEYIKDHIKKRIKGYLGDQEVISIALRKFKNISKGLYTLPLFTVGIPSEKKVKNLCIVHPIHCDKEFSLKERLLYYNDENSYYTSLLNRYVLFSRHILNKYLYKVINICKRYNLVLILPDQKCKMPNCIYKMKDTFGDSVLIKYLKSENISIRESTFLRHPLVPLDVKRRILHIKLKDLRNSIIKSYKTIIIK